MRYVTGLLFNERLTQVLLQKKNRGPAGVSGKYNGHGGKIEEGESPIEAIVRETIEETGIVTKPEDWLCFHHFKRVDSNEVFFFMSILPKEQKYRQIESETLTLQSVTDVLMSYHFDSSLDNPYVYNLSYLLPMASAYYRFPQFRYNNG